MRIEDEIQQSKSFTSNFEKVVVNILYTANWLKADQSEYFARYKLTGKQYNILRILRGAGAPISTAEIRKRMLDKMSDASRIVDRLEKKGLVIKRTCPEDQRKVDVTLSDAATKLLTQIDPELENRQKTFTNLTAEEALQLSNLLDKMRK